MVIKNIQLVVPEDSSLQIIVLCQSGDRLTVLELPNTTSAELPDHSLLLSKEHTSSLEIAPIIRKLGLPPNLKGYGYLRKAVEISLHYPDTAISIKKLIYPEVAHTFRTTEASVERSIRHAIQVIWTKGDRDFYRQLFPYSAGHKPTNSQFISLFTEYLKRQEGRTILTYQPSDL